MVTDDERRRVAAALREYASFDCEDEGEEECLVDCADWGERVLNLLGCGDTEGECYAALADLIEPSCDRERLLAIATVMAADSVRSAKQGSSVSPVYILHAARDIAEACGETFGSIRNRDLTEWGTSIVPKELVVDRDALLALADEMEQVADGNRMTGMMGIGRARSWAERIREACGEGER